MTITRCAWPGNDPLYLAYHDREWGVPVYDDRLLFEFLTGERRLDPKQTAAVMWRDYQRGGRHDKPAFLKDLLSSDGPPAMSRRIRTGVPKRQARHLV